MLALSLLTFCVALQTSTAHDYIIDYICKPEPALDREVCHGSYPGIPAEACLHMDCCYAETSVFATCFNKTAQTFDQALDQRLRDLTDAVISLRNTTTANTAEIRNAVDDLNTLRNTTTSEIRNVNDKLTTLNGKHSQDKSAQEVINARLGTTVAFMARMRGCHTGPKTIPYGNYGVALNVGGGFDASTHSFTAKHVGLYQFTWSFSMYGGAGYVGVSSLYKNGERLDVGTYTNRPSGPHSSPMVTQMGLLELVVGDVVEVRLEPEYYAHGQRASDAVFSGSLIRRTA